MMTHKLGASLTPEPFQRPLLSPRMLLSWQLQCSQSSQSSPILENLALPKIIMATGHSWSPPSIKLWQQIIP